MSNDEIIVGGRNTLNKNKLYAVHYVNNLAAKRFCEFAFGDCRAGSIPKNLTQEGFSARFTLLVRHVLRRIIPRQAGRFVFAQ